MIFNFILTSFTTGPYLSLMTRGSSIVWISSNWNAPLATSLGVNPPTQHSQKILPKTWYSRFISYQQPRTSQCCDFPNFFNRFCTVMHHKPLKKLGVTEFTRSWFWIRRERKMVKTKQTPRKSDVMGWLPPLAPHCVRTEWGTAAETFHKRMVLPLDLRRGDISYKGRYCTYQCLTCRTCVEHL